MSIKNYTLSILTILLFICSCSKDEIPEGNISEKAKSFTDTPDSNSYNDSYNTLSKSKIALLFKKDETQLSNEILERINQYRSSMGLQKLINNSSAKTQALCHSEYQGNNYIISHIGRSTRANKVFESEHASLYGENVAYGFTDIEKLVQAWINSESHRKNIEGDFNYTGIGSITNNQGVLYYTQIFFK